MSGKETKVTTDKLILDDGTAVHFRELRPDDMEILMTFYRALPKEDRRFLRIDVTNRDVVRKRMELMLQGQVFRIVAIKNSDKSIIADGAWISLQKNGERTRRRCG